MTTKWTYYSSSFTSARGAIYFTLSCYS